MKRCTLSLWILAFALICTASVRSLTAADPTAAIVAFEDRADRLVITLGGKPLAEYMKSGDDRTSRPFFRHVHAPDGRQVSINNPPGKGEPDDHHGYHVGLSQAFGRMGNFDTWRLKDRVLFAGYAQEPKGGPGKGTFAVKNRYLKGKDKDAPHFCTEVATFTILARPHNTLILWDSEFHADAQDIEFGDQEEMGLAIRVNAPMNVEENQLNHGKKQGRMLNSNGDLNEAGIRNGKQAEWCDYSGWVDDHFVGVQLMGHPDNFGRPWWHARDYGVLVCNPFARNDLGRGEKSRIQVKKGTKFRIRYGVSLHSGTKPMDVIGLNTAYEDYLEAASATSVGKGQQFRFEDATDGLVVFHGDEKVARYVHGDHRTTRPFFKEVHAPGGTQVSIDNPGKRPADHDHGALHPGLCQAFGDISGNDHWRMKSPVLHAGYVQKPKGGPNKGSFGVLNLLLTSDGEVYATETVHYTFLARPEGTLILWDSTIRSDSQELVFGDQQEMGMAIRVHALMNINAKKGGRILNSRGQLNERGENNVYGKPAEWCDYSGPMDGKFVGVCLMPHPENFRVSRFHARGYGVLVANPFAQVDFRSAFSPEERKKLEKNRTAIPRGKPFRQRWGILLHSGNSDGDVDLSAAYEDYLGQKGN